MSAANSNTASSVGASPKKGGIVRAEYEGQEVQFTNDGWIDATAVCARFGKKPIHWLELEATKSYLAALNRRMEKVGKDDLLIKTTKGRNGRTMFHPKLGVPMARWLDEDFAVWCDEQIDSIIRGEHPHFEQRRMRHAAAASNKFMRQMVERAREADGKETKAHHYINENLLVNKIVAGEFVGLDRDTMPAKLLDFLAATEGYNTLLYARGKSREDRITMLMTFRRKWIEKHGELPALNLADQPKLEARTISKQLTAAPKASKAAKANKVAKALKACRDAAANAVSVPDAREAAERRADVC